MMFEPTGGVGAPTPIEPPMGGAGGCAPVDIGAMLPVVRGEVSGISRSTSEPQVTVSPGRNGAFCTLSLPT